MSRSHDNADSHLEEIVAYLDGELSGESCAVVERRLASDEDYRQELQSVERAWNALDELPMTTVDDKFSRTTMSLVIDAATKDLQAKTRALPIIRRRRWATTALAASVALALGFLVFRLAWHDPNRMLMADLPVIDNIDVYSQFKEVDFLYQLEDELGGELERLSGDSAALDDREQHFADVTTPKDGQEWLVSLNDEDRTNLRAKFNRFGELTESERDRMRKLHQEIMTSPDARRLERTMLAYQQWLGGLPPVRQFELRNISDPQDRVALVKRWARQMRDDELLTLTDVELKAFFSELSGPINNLRREITKDDSNKGDDRTRMKLLLSQDFARWRSELVEQFGGEGWRGRFNRAVIEALPGRSRARFNGLAPQEKVERFLTWMRQHTACRGEITQEELEHFFADELNPEMRAQLLSLPPGEMEAALRRMYRCQPKKGAEGRWTWSPTLNSFVAEVAAETDDEPDADEAADDGEHDGDSRNGRDRNGRSRDGRGGEGGRGPNRRGFGEPPPGMRPPMDFGPPNPNGGPGFGGPGFGPRRGNGPPMRERRGGPGPFQGPPPQDPPQN